MPRPSSTRAPATRDQADAYRFGLRRLEAALVRGDPVPLHEQIRSQRRAALVGVLLGMLGLGAVLGYAKIVPAKAWKDQAVVVGSPSGAMFVVAGDRLVPVANLTAARLVAAAVRGPGAGDPARLAPVTIADASLAEGAHTPTAAVPGAVAVRPDATVAAGWAVCDQVTDGGQVAATTVLGGVAAPVPDPDGDSVLLAGPDSATWLVTGGHRHRLDTSDGRLLAAFGLSRPVPRSASADLLSLIPEGPALAIPDVPRRGDPAPAGLPGRVGDVLVTQPGGSPAQYYVVLAAGLQKTPKMIGELLAESSPARAPRPVASGVLDAAAQVDLLRVNGWPADSLRVLEPADAPVTCWTWVDGGVPGGGTWWGAALPRTGSPPVPLAQADGAGPRIDAVAVGGGGTVRATGPGRAPGAGPLWLVSAGGVAYGVADAATAAALGVGPAAPAPEAALRLLPVGPLQDLAQAGHVVDVLPGG
ncbi:type VII secretion protein EccB [Pseudonocardia sp. GCM10023141]|uniref:type VII secretion protein EccB n=1 Tax=Pseudonocardia sp. GCM10023141 TaxID=3252653 RepID=UPI0036087A25